METVMSESISRMGSDRASIMATLDGLAVEGLGFEVEALSFSAFHGVGLDDLDALEGLLEDFVDIRHAFKRAPDGAFHDLADLVGGEGGDGDDDEGEAGQPPVEPESA